MNATLADPRLAAAIILKPVLQQQQSLSVESFSEAEKSLSANDQGFLRELCYGTLRYQPLLMAYIERLLEKPLRNKDADITALLLLGIYQLDYLRVPDHAALNATVNCCQGLGKSWAKKLVNGVLRNYLKRRDELQQALTWWQRCAHPKWLAESIKRAWPDQYQQVLEANNHQAPLCLRLSPGVDRQDYQEKLLEQGMASEPCQWSPQGLRLQKSTDVQQLPGYEEGSFAVQDEAAQLAAYLLAPQDGQRILDACAAPGGKTAHLLAMQKQINLVALDKDARRCQTINENLERLKLAKTGDSGTSVIVKAADANRLDQWWDGQCFDGILLDAPCSATGIIRRHPDIKLLRQSGDIANLVQQQRTLLDTVWQTLSPGGVLLYATCSILIEENEQVVADFIANTADARSVRIDANWGIGCQYGRQLLPQRYGTDGFYYTKIQKRRQNTKTAIT